MAKLVFLFLLVLGAQAVAKAKNLQLELYAQTELPRKFKNEKPPVGGISGIFWDGHKLMAVSDDRGKFGKPRFYELELKIDAKKADLKILQQSYFTALPRSWVADLEAFALLPNGDFLLSTEGDNNKKPRALPHLFVTLPNGAFKYDIELPDKFLPETTGQQKKGIENNRGLEGITAKPNGETLFAVNEYPVVVDQGDDDLNYWLRVVEFNKTKDKQAFKYGKEYPYRVTRLPKNSKGPEVFRGISEILFSQEGQLLVLERGARLTKTGLAYTAGIYQADYAAAKDVSSVKSLVVPMVAPMSKTLLVDLEEIFTGKNIENFEALSWGPNLPDGRKSLLVMSDNNFSSNEKTLLLVFAVKEVP